MLRILSVSIVLVCVAASPAFAQICAGAPSFNGAPLQVSGNMGMSKHAQMAGAAFGGGTDTGFATLFLGGLKLDGVNDTGVRAGATMGADPAVDRGGRVRLCPLGSIAYVSGPALRGLNTATLDFQVGGRLGVIAADTAAVQVIPTFGLAYAYTRFWLRMPAPIDDVAAFDNYAIASVGTGFVFNRRIAITPLVSFPLGLDDDDPEFNLSLTVNLGH